VYILHTRRRADVLDGADVAAWLKAYRGALTIGEETSGGSAATTAGLRPNWCCRISQIKVVIPLMQFWNAVGEFRSARSGVPADHLVRPTMDLLGARDPELETAKGLIAAPR